MLEEKPDHCTCCTPTNSKSKWFKIVVVFLAIGFCTYQFGIKPLLDEQDTNGKGIGRILQPGFHIIELFPFITVVPERKVGVIWRSASGSKSFTKHPATEIPEGYVGVLTDRQTGVVQSKPLLPGTYYLNPKLYKVDEVFIGKQTYYYGGAEDD